MENYPTPVALEKANDRVLRILWSDSTSTEYDVRKLRYNCSCARCINEWNGNRIVRMEDIPKNMKPAKIDSVGNYALRITWMDGHDSGIYSYKALKNVLPALTLPDEEEKPREQNSTLPPEGGCCSE